MTTTQHNFGTSFGVAVHRCSGIYWQRCKWNAIFCPSVGIAVDRRSGGLLAITIFLFYHFFPCCRVLFFNGSSNEKVSLAKVAPIPPRGGSQNCASLTSHRYELASDVVAGGERVPPALLGWYIIKAGIMDE